MFNFKKQGVIQNVKLLRCVLKNKELIEISTFDCLIVSVNKEFVKISEMNWDWGFAP